MKINLGWAVIAAFFFLFPSLLPTVTFTAYIKAGHALDFNIAVASLVIFKLLEETLINVPFFFTEVLNLIVSMKRIEGFLDLDEVQSDMIERNLTS